MSAASISSNSPCFTKLPLALPLVPPSSAGVPKTNTSPPVSSAAVARAIAAAVLIVPIRLWPQAWPSPGRASYSAKNPIFGPGLEEVLRAINPVSCPATFRVTSKPAFSKMLVSVCEAKNSAFPISGRAWIAWLVSMYSDFADSICCLIRSFWLSKYVDNETTPPI
ncbi:hypothetical protein D3C73_1248410 [compost metagenome]